MKKAVIYGRVSTQDQDFSRQFKDMDDWAKKNNYQVAGRFGEKITGASKAYERREFTKLQKYIKANDIKMILVSELSRMGRLGVDTRVEIETLARDGVNMFFLDKNLYTLDHKGRVDSHTMMLIGILSDLAKIERDATANRIVSGLKNSAYKGHIQSSKFKPYGFAGDPETKKIIVREDEFKTVKRIFEMFDKGITTNAITTWLNQNDIPTRYHDFTGTILRGKTAESYSWTDRTVYRILTNRMWIGERHHKKELVYTSEPLLDVDMFERVQTKLATRANKRLKVVKNTNYLKDIIKCSCGRGMFQNIDPNRGMRTYACNSRAMSKQKKTEYCGNPSINIDKLLDSLHNVISEKYINKQSNKPSIDFDNKIEAKKIELANIEKAVKKGNTKLDNLYEDYNDRIITKERYLSVKEKLEKEIENHTASIEELRNDLTTLNTAKSNPLLDFYTKDMFLNEAKNILKMVTIGKALKKDEKLIIKTDTDFGISVTATTLTGKSFNFLVTRFSKNYLIDGKLKPINEVKGLTVGDLHITLRKPLPKPKTRGKGKKKSVAVK